MRIAAAYDPLATLQHLRNEHRVLASIAGGDVLRFAPPLNVQRQEIDAAVAKLRLALRDAPAKK